MAAIAQRQNDNVIKNNKETCPGCGNRTRYPEHPLCPKCNAGYIEITARALAGSGQNQPIIGRKEFAAKKGEETRARLTVEVNVGEKLLTEKQGPVWRQAHQQIHEALTERDIVRVDRRTYGKAVGVKFNELWGTDKDGQQLSRRIYGLKKAIDSLGKFLDELATDEALEKDIGELKEAIASITSLPVADNP